MSILTLLAKVAIYIYIRDFKLRLRRLFENYLSREEYLNREKYFK